MKIKTWFDASDVELFRSAIDTTDEDPAAPPHCSTCRCKKRAPLFHFFDEERARLHEMADRMQKFVDATAMLEANFNGDRDEPTPTSGTA